MPRAAVHVVYDDGTEATIPVKPISLVASERHFKGDIPAIEGTLYAAWHSAKKPMGNFDAWVSKIDDMDEIDLDAEREDATAAAGEVASPEVTPAE